MNKFLFCILIICCVSLASCSLFSGGRYFSTDSTLTPNKSENDRREYRYIRLNNQLKVLLVSDPLAEKASASLDLNVGSRQDPKTSEGLAHFLEHMLFLGTEKYPSAGEYQAFINEHGGAHNAYTSFEHTNYFFDIKPEYLEETLDRFSQFFISPLFTEAYVEREKNAVHSEYTSKLKSDDRKSLDVFKQLVNPEHPFSKFSVGNLNTLSSSTEGELRKELMDFYQKYYSANIMTLVVVGDQPLDELQEIVEPRFSLIKNNNITINPINAPLFAKDTLPLMVSIKPEKEQRVLTMTFPISEVKEYYQQKPLQYLANIIGHEGEGSLLSFLKSRMWAEGLSAGVGLSYAGGSNFNISVHLTESGVLHYTEVVKASFQVLNRLREAGPKKWLFDEQSSVANMQFKYKESMQPINYSRSLASDMHNYPIKDLLLGPYIFKVFDEELINGYLSQLTPENMLLILTAPNVPTNQHSPFYQTAYSVNDILDSQLALWKASDLSVEIDLPERNQFIAEDFSLSASEGLLNDSPELIVDKNNIKIWYKNDDKFNIPKGFMSLSVRSSNANKDVKSVALLELYVAMLNEQLNEFSYPATLAGLHYSLHPHMRGLSVKVSGFNDKQDELFQKIIAVVTNPVFSEEVFTRVKTDLLRRLDNAEKQQPYKMLMGDLSELLYKQSFDEKDIGLAMNDVDLKELSAYVAQFLASVDLNGLLYGNYQQEDVDDFVAHIDGMFSERADGKANLPAVEVTRLKKVDLAYRVNNSYNDAALVYYVQAVNNDKLSRAALSVVAQMYRPDFYTQLRTEKQLGYIVSSGAYPVYEIPGLYFVIQSPVASADKLQREVSAFVEQKRLSIDVTDFKEFDAARQVLIQRLSEQPTNLAEQAQRYWQDIAYSYYDFDYKQQLIDALEQLTLEAWKELVKENLLNQSRHGIWLYSPGVFEVSLSEQFQPVKSRDTFKLNHDYYQFH